MAFLSTPSPDLSYSDIGIGQSQDDSIVGMRQTKHIPPALPVSGTLSSSNPDLLQSHHRILDFNTTPGEHCVFIVALKILPDIVYSGTITGEWVG